MIASVEEDNVLQVWQMVRIIYIWSWAVIYLIFNAIFGEKKARNIYDDSDENVMKHDWKKEKGGEEEIKDGCIFKYLVIICCCWIFLY